mmetsp:Transcript_17764/g.41698  ORF Transcript_17764/g.41698 Transcript_17764/m.41698 type:complete len:575 (+) Transcript_17764:49-1773(+)
MAAAVASYPGPPRQEALLGTPPSSHRQTQPLPGSHGHGHSPGHPLFQRGRRVATPVSALARLWGDEPRREEPQPQPLSISASAAAPSGPNLAARARAATQASWNRRSLSPQRPTVPQPQPVFIRAQDTAPGPATDTPRTRFQESPSPRSRHRSIRPSMTPSRMGFPDPTSPPADYRAVRQTSMSPPRAASRQTVVPPPKEDEDLIHQHVLYILKKNPDVSKSRKVQQVTPGVYLLDGHEVNIEWRHSREPGKRGCPVVVDGPMRQPLIDYLRFSEENKEYDTETVACTTSLHQVPKDKRMTFDDRHKQYSRLEAMKVAKEQACIREQAADCLLDGKQVPDDLVRRYNKALRSKIRSREKDGSGPERRETLVPSPAGTPTPATPATPVAPAAAPAAAAAAAAPKVPVRIPELPRLPERALPPVVQAQALPCSHPSRQPSPAAMRMAAQAMAGSLQAPPRSGTPRSPMAAEVLAPFPAIAMSQRGISLNGLPPFGPVATASTASTATATAAPAGPVTGSALTRVARSWSSSSVTSLPYREPSVSRIPTRPTAQVVTAAPITVTACQSSSLPSAMPT